MEAFQTVQKPSRLSENFPNCPKTFQTVQKLSRLSRNFPDLCYVLTWFWAHFLYTRKNFPDAQKLSGWQCQRANGLFLTLPQISNMLPNDQHRILHILHIRARHLYITTHTHAKASNWNKCTQKTCMSHTLVALADMDVTELVCGWMYESWPTKLSEKKLPMICSVQSTGDHNMLRISALRLYKVSEVKDEHSHTCARECRVQCSTQVTAW